MRLEIDYNLDKNGAVCKGMFLYGENGITVLENGNEVFRIVSENIEDFKIDTNIGVSTLLVKIKKETEIKNEEEAFGSDDNKKGGPDDKDYTIVCNFSNKYATQFSVFIKYFNFAKKQGNEISVNELVRLIKGDDDLIEAVKEKDRIQEGTFGKMLSLLGKHKGKVATVVCLNLIVYLAIVAMPLFNSHLLDNFLQPAEGAEVPGIGVFITIIAFILGLTIIRAIFMGLRSLTNGYMGHTIAQDLRQSLFSKMQALSLKNFSKRSTGSLINRTVSDTERVSRFLTFEFIHAFNQAILALIIFTVLVVLNWFMALIIVAPLIIVVYAMRQYFKYMRKKYNKQWALGSKSTNTLVDILQGIRVVKVFGTEKREVERFVKTSADLRDISERNEKIWHYIYPYLMAMVFLGQIAVTYFGGEAVLGTNSGNPTFIGPMTIGQLYLFYVMASMLFDPLVNASNLPRWMAEAMVSANKIFEVLDEPDYEPKNTIKLDIQGSVEIKNLSFGYKPYKTVLKDVSLSASKGDMIGIVGKTGAGKSTLINLIMRLYTPTEGDIYIDGVNLQDIDESSLRSQLGIVMQDNFLFSGSILENITYTKPNATMEEIIHASTLASAHEFVIKLEDGYNTVVGEKGYTLSGGERQRISIARALLHNPKILILDEATSSLDTETEKQIQQALQVLTQNRTTFAIAHRLSTLRHATKIIVIADSGIAESGTHEQLLEHKGIYYNLVNAQREMLADRK